MNALRPALLLEGVVSTRRGLARHRALADAAPDGQVLRGVELQVARGEAVLILGPSGGGKTTLLRLAARLVEPDAGRVEVLGRDVRAWSPAELRRSAVFVPQHPVALGETVAADLAAPLAWAGRAVEPDRLTAALTRVGLGAVGLESSPTALSGGQRARLNLARALLLEPQLLLLDEPTGSLDVRTARELLACLEAWRAERGGALVVVTHRPEDAARLGDRVYVLLESRLRGPFDPGEVAAGRAADPEVQAFLGRAPEDRA